METCAFEVPIVVHSFNSRLPTSCLTPTCSGQTTNGSGAQDLTILLRFGAKLGDVASNDGTADTGSCRYLDTKKPGNAKHTECFGNSIVVDLDVVHHQDAAKELAHILLGPSDGLLTCRHDVMEKLRIEVSHG